MANMPATRVAGRLLAKNGQAVYEGLGKSVGLLNTYSPVIESDVKTYFPQIANEVGAKSVHHLMPEMFVEKRTCSKKTMGNWLIELSHSLNLAYELLKVANTTISTLQSTAIEDKETIIKLKDEIISLKNEDLKSVSTTVQSQMKSFTDIVKENGKKAVVTQKKLTKAIKTVAEEEDRGRNLMIFGLQEDEEESLTDKVDELFSSIGEKPSVRDCVRIGKTSDKEESKVRPVKVIMRSSDTVDQLLRKSGKLRGLDNFKSVYLSPDRTIEERAAHQQLVLQIKEKIKSDPSNYHFIDNGTVTSKPKTVK